MAPRSHSRSYSKSVSKSRSRSRSKSRSPIGRRSRSRSRSRSSRSRSRSPVRRRRSYSRSRSVSRSRSRSPRRGRESKSPMSNRKRHVGDRDAPPPGKCLGVFGLSLYTTEREVRDFFERYGEVQECKIVHDHATGRSRGFAFVNMATLSGAEDAKERLNGSELDGRRIRVDYSITQRPHTPTPGVYMGRPTQSSMGRSRRGGGGGGGGYGGGRNGGGRYGYRQSRSRSRSRSRSPYRYRY